MGERFIEVYDPESGIVINRVEVTGNSEMQIEMCMRGMLINLHPMFLLRDTNWNSPPEETAAQKPSRSGLNT